MYLKTSFIILIQVSLVTLVHPQGCTINGEPNTFTLQNNEYEDIIIAIAADIPEDPNIIEHIKRQFTSASAVLYQATKQRSFFKRIKILVPDKWNTTSKDESAGSITFNRANFQIYQGLSGGFTAITCSKVGGEICGAERHHVEMSLSNITAATDIGKVIVHEFAHLRYGVGDESNFQDASSVCSLGLLEYNDGTASYASLMYSTAPEIVAFCEQKDVGVNFKVVHNTNANNNHNKLCQQRSVWEVLESHPDFNNANPSRTISSTSPEFVVIGHEQSAGAGVIVLVLDISGSMNTNDRRGILSRGCSRFLNFEVLTGTQVAIILFNNQAEVVLSLTEVTDTNRNQLASDCPNRASDGTSIGLGIRTALNHIRSSLVTTEGSTLVIMSDGHNTADPDINDVLQELNDANVIVHTIAITDGADSNLDALAIQFGGLAFIQLDDVASSGINTALQRIAAWDQANFGSTNFQTVGVPIYSRSLELSASTPISETFIVDNDLGKDTLVVFDYGENVLPNIALRSPGPNDVSSLGQHDGTQRFVSFNFPGMTVPQNGMWEYAVTTSVSTPIRVAVTVQSSPSTALPPILARVFWASSRVTFAVPGAVQPPPQRIFVYVTRGYFVVNNVHVVATLMGPNGDQTVTALHNGVGADQAQGDGIYSHYVMPNGIGRYTVSVRVSGDETSVVSYTNLIGATLSGSLNINEAPTSTGNFQRDVEGEVMTIDGDATAASGTVALYPPARVNDLTVHSVDAGAGIVTLTWTAVGKELLTGTASEYTIRVHQAYGSLRDDFNSGTLLTSNDIIVGSLTNLQPAMSSEQFQIRVPNPAGLTYYTFGLLVRDLDGRTSESEVSNLVTATVVVCYGDCKNGQCVEGVSPCQCQTGWGGTLCDTLTCNPSICQHQGVCNSSSTSCQCQDTYEGDLCQTPVFMQCDQLNCGPDQTCEDTVQGGRCRDIADSDGLSNEYIGIIGAVVGVIVVTLLVAITLAFAKWKNPQAHKKKQQNKRRNNLGEGRSQSHLSIATYSPAPSYMVSQSPTPLQMPAYQYGQPRTLLPTNPYTSVYTQYAQNYYHPQHMANNVYRSPLGYFPYH